MPGTIIGAAAGVIVFPTTVSAVTAGSFSLTSVSALTGLPLAGALLGQGLLTAAGTMLDQQLIFPRLFRESDRVHTPTADDFQLQVGSEGSPIKRAYGQENRVTGTVLWKSPIAFSPVRINRQWVNLVNVDIAVGLLGHEISAIEKVYANDRLIIDTTATADVSLSGTDISANRWKLVSHGIDLAFPSFEGIILESTTTDLTDGGKMRPWIRNQSTAVPGPVVVDGFSNTENNQPGWPVVISNTVVLLAYPSRAALISAVPEAAGATVTITQEMPEFAPGRLEGFEFYTGTQTQLPSPTIEAALGVGNVPAFRGRAYAVLKGLVLQEYGNRLPQLTFVFKESAAPRTLVSVLEDVVTFENPLTAANVDTSAITGGDIVRGALFAQPMRGVDELQPLLMVHDCIAQEIGPKITFRKRTGGTPIPVEAADLEARPEGVPPNMTPIGVGDVSDLVVPRILYVQYTDPDINYRRGSQHARREEIIGSSPSLEFSLDNSSANVEVPITLLSGEAKALATRLLFQRIASRQNVTLSLPPSMGWLLEGHRLAVPFAGDTLEILISSIDRGEGGVLQIKGNIQVSKTSTQQEVDSDTNPAQPFVPPPGFPFILTADVPALVDAHADTAGIYIGAALVDQQATFDLIEIYSTVVSGDNETLEDDDFELITVIDNEATIGIAETVLAEGIRGYFDEANTVDVIVLDGILANATAQEIYNGANLALVGDEVIHFKTATLNSAPGRYTLSGLLRGVRGTPMTGHQEGDRFLLLDLKELHFHPLKASEIGVTHSFRGVPKGTPFSESQGLDQVSYVAGTARPTAPTGIQGRGWIATGGSSYKRNARTFEEQCSVLITWNRTLLKPTSPMKNFAENDQGFQLPPGEHFEVEIYDPASPTTLLETYVVPSPAFVYTGDDQVDDGISAAGAIPIKVHHVSDKYGRSVAAEAEV